MAKNQDSNTLNFGSPESNDSKAECSAPTRQTGGCWFVFCYFSVSFIGGVFHPFLSFRARSKWWTVQRVLELQTIEKQRCTKETHPKNILKKWHLFSIYGLVTSHIQKPIWRLYHKGCYCTYFSHILFKLLQAQTLDMKPGSQEAAVAKPLAASPIRDRRSEALKGAQLWLDCCRPPQKKNTWKKRAES